MGRIARPPSAQSEALRSSLRQYLISTSTSVNAYAKAQGLSQSTLYRFWVGQTKEPSKVLRPALDYAHNATVGSTSAEAPVITPLPALRRMALQVCGNQMDDALILEQIVLALAPVVRSFTQRKNRQPDD